MEDCFGVPLNTTIEILKDINDIELNEVGKCGN